MVESRIDSIGTVIERFEATHLSSQSKEELEIAIEVLLKQNLALLNLTEDRGLAESVDQEQIQRILVRLMRVTAAYQEQIAIVENIREESTRNSIHSSNSSHNLHLNIKTEENGNSTKTDKKERVVDWVKEVPAYDDLDTPSPALVISQSMLGLLPPSLNASMEHISEASTPRRTETQRIQTETKSPQALSPQPKPTPAVVENGQLTFILSADLKTDDLEVDSDHGSIKAIKDFELSNLSKPTSFQQQDTYSSLDNNPQRWTSFVNEPRSLASQSSGADIINNSENPNYNKLANLKNNSFVNQNSMNDLLKDSLESNRQSPHPSQ